MKDPPGSASVEKLFDAHARVLLLYARQWAGGSAAEDVIQRVFVRLLSQSVLPAEPLTWLFKCVRNEAIDVWRTEHRRERREQAVAIDAHAWFMARPQDGIDVREAQTALAALPPELREVVTLRLWSDLTLSEIADVTGVATSTVHKRYDAAIDALRQILEEPCKTQDK